LSDLQKLALLQPCATFTLNNKLKLQHRYAYIH